MGFFSSIKKAFAHPVDVNIVSDLRFAYSAVQLPLKIEFINKDKKADINLASIVVEIQRFEMQQGDTPTSVTSASQQDSVGRTEQPISVIVPVSGQPVYLELAIANSISQVLSAAAQAVLPDNAVVDGLLGMASKLEQAGRMMNMNQEYSYKIDVNVMDETGSVVGFDNKPAYFQKSGEIITATTFST